MVPRRSGLETNSKRPTGVGNHIKFWLLRRTSKASEFAHHTPNRKLPNTAWVIVLAAVVVVSTEAENGLDLVHQVGGGVLAECILVTNRVLQRVSRL